MTIPNDVTLSPAFAAVAATDLDITSMAEFTGGIGRVPRLEVPVDVRALYVAEGDQVDHADVSTLAILDAALSDLGEVDPATAKAADPFTDVGVRKPGVYVHWAVPDALLAAEVDSDDGESVQPDAAVDFPALPNRWCLTRFWWSLDKKRYLHRSWIVQADTKAVIPVEDWVESTDGPVGETPDVGPADLTAVLGGDAAWFAVYDNVEDRFGFRDDLSDLADADLPVHYTVVGWYSDRTLDPLAGTRRVAGFEQRLCDLGWAADTSSLAGAEAWYRTVRDQAGALAELRGDSIGADDGVVDLSDTPTIPRTVLDEAASVIALPRPYWPRQALFHGTIYNVGAAGVRDSRPRATSIDVGIGGTTTEALSALMAESADETEEAAREQLLNALQYGLIDQLEQPDGPPQLAAEMHRRAFESRPGGYSTERVRAGDPFAHLRTPVDAAGVRTTPPVDVVADDVESSGVVFEFLEGTPNDIHHVHVQNQPDPEIRIGIDDVGTIRGGGSGPGGSFLGDPPDWIPPPGVRALAPDEIISPQDIRLGIGTTETVLPGRSLVDGYLSTDRPFTSPRHTDGAEYVTVKRALPRLFYSQDPALAIRGGGRSLRFRSGTDLDAEGRLVCRLSGEEATSHPGIASGADLLAGSLFVAHIPLEAKALLEEAVLHVLGGHERVVDVVLADDLVDGDLVDGVAVRLHGEDRLYEQSLVPGTRANDVFVDSLCRGFHPSPKAITAWYQPWEPTYLEWDVTVELDRRADHWRLGDLDFAPAGEHEADHTTRLAGRALLSTTMSTGIRDLLSAFIKQEQDLDAGAGTDGVLDDGALADLIDMNAEAAYADVMSCSFDGVRDHLLGFDTNVRLTESGTDGEIIPDRLPELLRAGRARVNRLRIVDAFGRSVDLDGALSVGDRVEVTLDDGTDASRQFLLPPRILAPSRLWFRFVDATDDSHDAIVDQEEASYMRSPIAGWLLPDHVDGALEVFDAAGNPAGQVRNQRLGAGVVWEGPPGAPGPMGAAPFQHVADPHTAELVRAMIERDIGARESGVDHGESTLDAFLRVVDTTLWTVDPFADSGLDYYAKMTGRPIAVVRARLLLDVVSDFEMFSPGDPRFGERKAAYDELSQRRFSVRLGSLARLDDGLLGYFVDDDYRSFHPVHASVREQALPTSRNAGFLGGAGDAAGFDLSEPAPITHPYIVGDPTVEVQAGHPVRLTLLMDPGTRVHATSGVLPRKAIGLPRAFVQDALARIAPSFRFGPLLVDPAVIRLPKPSVLPEDQVWTRRDTPTTWRDDAIEAATQFAYLPDTTHEAQEGYVRVRLDL